MLIFSKAAKAILAFRSFSICFLVSRLLSFISFLGNTRLMEEKEHITSSFIIIHHQNGLWWRFPFAFPLSSAIISQTGH